MDYHSLKRSQLQALCKKHNIPGNSTNAVMADKLSELLNVKEEKQKPKAGKRPIIKNSVETVDESESAVSRRQSKKVRFSPEVEYERSGKKPKDLEPVVTEMKGRSRRKSVARNVDKPVVDKDDTETDDVQIPVKVTRSRAHTAVKDDVIVIPTNDKKRGRKAVKDVEKETEEVKEPEANVGKVTRSKANTVGKSDVQPEKSKQSKRAVKEVEKESEPVKEAVVGRGIATRSKVETLTEEIKEPDLIPEVKKRRGKQPTVKDDEKVEPSKEVKDVPVRATRSRGQTSKDDSVDANSPPVEKKRTRRDDNVVVNPPIEKKRTRRDTIVIDLSSYNEGEVEKLGRGGRKKTSEVKTADVPEVQENADKGKRPTRRTKATVEDSKNEEETKEEVVIEKKVTRSKAVKESSKGKGKSKDEVQETEEPSKPAGKRVSNRRKSVFQPKDIEVVLPLEEPVNVPAKKDTRRKTVVPKAQVKETKKPAVTKKETVKETQVPESPKAKTPKTVEKEQSKDASESEKKEVASPSGKQKAQAKESKKSAVTKKETVKETQVPESPKAKTPKSVGKKQSKDDSECETKDVASPSGSQKSRKRREPVVEEQTIVTEPVSTRKSSVAKKEPGSSVKTPASKRAKLSEKKQSALKNNAEESDAVGTPVSKMADLETVEEEVENLETVEKVVENHETVENVVETEKTPAVAESSKRFTRGARSEKKEAVQSAIKEQNTGAGKASTRKTPGRATRSGIKKVEEKKQESEPTQIVPPEDVEVKPSQDVSSPVPSEASIEDASEVKSHEEVCNEADVEKAVETEKTPAVVESSRRVARGGRSEKRGAIQSAIKEQNTGAGIMSTCKTPGRATRSGIKKVEEKKQESESTHESQPLVDSQIPSKPEDADVSSPVASESTKEADTSVSEYPTVKEDASSVPIEDDASGVKSHDEVCNGPDDGKDDKIPDGTPSPTTAVSDINVTPVLVDNVAEATIDAVSDEIPEQIQNEEVNVNLGTVSEADVQVAVNLAKAVLRSVFPQVSEMENEMAKSGQVVQDDNVFEEPSVSAVKTVVTEENVGTSLEQSDIKGKSKEVAVPESLTTQSEPEKEVESDVVTSTGDDVFEIPKSDDGSGDKHVENIREHESNTNDQNRESEQEQDELATENDQTLVDENPILEETSPIQNLKEESGVDGLVTEQHPGDVEAFGSPDTVEEKVPVDKTVADPPTSVKDEDRNKQDEHVSGLQTSSPAVASAPGGYYSWSDSNLKALWTTPGTTQTTHVKGREQSRVKFALPDEDDTKGSTPENPSSSLKALFTTPATTQVRSNTTPNLDSSLKALFTTPATSQESPFSFGIPEKDDTQEKAPPQYHPDMSLKSSLKTPATTRVSNVRFALPDEDDTKGTATKNLTTLFTTPATTQAKYSIPDEVGNATQNPDSSLKALFTTEIPDQDDDDAPQNVHSTPATTWVSHRKDKQKTVAFAFLQDDTGGNATTQTPGSSLKALFTTPATAQVTQEHIATPYPHASLKNHQQSAVRFDVSDQDDIEGGSVPQNQDSSLRTFFATPATTVRFDDSFDQDKNQGSTTQNQDLGQTFKVQTFEDITRSFFGDYSESEDNTTNQNPDLIEDPKSQTFEDLFFDNEEDANNSSGDNLGKVDFNQMDDDQQAPGSSHHQNNNN